MSDIVYLSTVDLPLLAAKVPKDKESRKTDQHFHDMITAIAVQQMCCGKSFSTNDLLTYLGVPDSVKDNGDAQVWCYEWVDWFGHAQYQSATGFQVRQGRVEGVAPRKVPKC